jgi:hypothetical protein
LSDASFGGGSLLGWIGRSFTIEEDDFRLCKAFLQILSAEVIFATKIIKTNLAAPE